MAWSLCTFTYFGVSSLFTLAIGLSTSKGFDALAGAPPQTGVQASLGLARGQRLIAIDGYPTLDRYFLSTGVVSTRSVFETVL